MRESCFQFSLSAPEFGPRKLPICALLGLFGVTGKWQNNRSCQLILASNCSSHTNSSIIGLLTAAQSSREEKLIVDHWGSLRGSHSDHTRKDKQMHKGREENKSGRSFAYYCIWRSVPDQARIVCSTNANRIWAILGSNNCIVFTRRSLIRIAYFLLEDHLS